MKHEQMEQSVLPCTARQEEEAFLCKALSVIRNNIDKYDGQVSEMKKEIDDMLEHFHDDNPELINALENTITLHDHMKRALERNIKALNKPYFGRIIFQDETNPSAEESLYIGRGGVSSDATHQVIVDWRAPVANAYYENGLGKCSYTAPGGKEMKIDLKLKRTYEIEQGKLLDYFDSEVIANDDLLTKYLAKNKQAVLGEIVATIQKEQNEIIRKSPYHNIIVQGVAGSGKTTVAMHRISFILYNYQERFKPEDFYIVGSNRILLNYITGVLPDLDVYGIRQMTMEQLFVRLLYEDWDEKKYGIKKGAQGDNRGSIKGGLNWFQDLKAYCDSLEQKYILKESIYLNPKQFVEGLRDGKSGVYDETSRTKTNPKDLVLLVDGAAVERYIRQTPNVSLQSKINMLNDRLTGKIKEEFLGKGVKYSEVEKKAILKAYHGKYGPKIWKGPSIYQLYQDFLCGQAAKGMDVDIPENEFDVYDLAALAYLYKRMKETEVISEAHHIVIDEAQDFGMMAYSVLDFCINGCTYTVMGDVSQNIHFGFGLNDWEELKHLLLPDEMDSFGILKKSYRNTVEISDFATNILHHGSFSSYPVEPIIRHGDPVKVEACGNSESLIQKAADICRQWQKKGFDTIAVVCRNQKSADTAARELGRYVEVMESDLEKAVFSNGIMVLPVEYTKGLEFDTVLILDPDREDYPVDDGHAKLLYVAATRALHELCILHTGNLTGLITDSIKTKKHEAQETPIIQKKSNTSENQISSHTQDASPAQNASGAQNASPAQNPSGIQNAFRAQNASDTQNISGKQGKPEKGKPTVKVNNAQRPRVVINTSAGQNTAFRTGNPAQLYARKPPSVSEPLKPSAAEYGRPDFRGTSAHISGTEAESLSAVKEGSFPGFGDMPSTEKLRPLGHSRPDFSIRWVTKQSDGLYLQSRYGILRLSPVGSAIMRISFCRNGQPDSTTPFGIAVNRTEKFWMYRESGNTIEMTTDELLIQADKASGALRYLSRDKKLLVAEQNKECRLMEEKNTMENGKTAFQGRRGLMQAWLFFQWAKGEKLYGFGAADDGSAAAASPGFTGISLRGSARYLSDHTNENPPFLLSDRGYGIVLPAKYSAFCCDIVSYGSYLYTECERQLDFYLIAGKRQDTILNAYEYLCGRR